MSDLDFVGALRDAIAAAGDNWTTQPSRLRRSLQRELGPEARRYRAGTHQIVVAAEERVPVRLRRNGWSPHERRDLVDLLVTTRGWTPEAAEWAVVTWAAALGLTDEIPPTAAPLPAAGGTRDGAPTAPGSRQSTGAGAATDVSAAPDVSRRPGGGLVEGAAPPAAASSHATEVPGGSGLVDGTEIPGDVGPWGDATELPCAGSHSETTDVVSSEPVSPAAPSGPPAQTPPSGSPAQDEGGGTPPEPPVQVPPSGPFVPAVSSDQLPKGGTAAATKKARAFLGSDLDVAYAVTEGFHPAVVLAPLVLVLVGFVMGGPGIGILPLLGFVGVLVLMFCQRARIIAIAGDRVTLIDAGRVMLRPSAILAEVPRNAIEPGDSGPYASVRIGEHRLWFPPIRRGAAVALTQAQP